jgi:hypothetical protein
MANGSSTPNYRDLPRSVEAEELVVGVETRTTQMTPNPFDSPDPPLHIVGYA